MFIAFEGPDGSGKSTQVRMTGQWLESIGQTPVLTRQPGGTDLGLQLRTAVLHGDHLDPRTEVLLFAADKAHHVTTVIRPALAAGHWPLTDRYVDSSVAYQGDARGVGADTVRDIMMWAVGGLLPHLTIVLDLDPQHALTRAVTGGADRIEAEGVAFQHKVRAGILACAAADPDRYAVIDATGSEDEVQQRVRDAISACATQKELAATA